MEQSRESPVHPTTNVPRTTTNLSATSVFQHVASKFAAGLHRNLSAAASTPAPVAMASVNLKQSRTNETPAGLSSAKSTSVASIVSLPPAGSANIEVEKGVNFTQSGGTVTCYFHAFHILSTSVFIHNPLTKCVSSCYTGAYCLALKCSSFYF